MRLILLVSEALTQEKSRTRTVEVDGERILSAVKARHSALRPALLPSARRAVRGRPGYLWMKDLEAQTVRTGRQ